MTILFSLPMLFEICKAFFLQQNNKTQHTHTLETKQIKKLKEKQKRKIKKQQKVTKTKH